MQTNNSGLGEEYTRRRDTQVTVSEQTPSVFGDSGVASYYSNLHPKYSGYNPLVFRNKMLTDNQFRQQYVQDFVDFSSGDPRVQELAQQDPEGFQERTARFEANLINSLTQDTRRGQSIPDAIIDRDRQLRTTQDGFRLNSKRINSIIKSNPNRYRELGIIDRSGELLYDIPALNQKLNSDEELQVLMLEDNYSSFLNALSKSHNEGSIDDSNINQLAQAYAVYDNFGEEGLTHFSNLQQHYQDGVDFDGQDQRVRQALTFMSRARKNGMSPFQHMDSFLGSAEDENNMIWQPEQTSLDIGADLPIDLNQFTNYRYESQDATEYIQNLMGAAIRGESENLRNVLRQRYSEEIKAGATLQDVAGDQEFLDSVAYDLLNDLDSRESQLFHIDLVRYARSGEGTFNLQDVVNTLISNSDAFHYDPERDKSVFKINYDDADVQTRLALRMLEKDVGVGGYANALTLQDGVYTFDPNRQERIQERFNNAGGILSPTWSWDEVPVEFEDGSVEMMRVPDTSFTGQVANFIPAMSWTAGQFINDYLVRPTSSFTGNILNNIGLENLTQTVSDSSFATWIEEAGDFDMYEDSRGFLPTAGMIGTELAGYIAGSMTLGRLGIAGATRMAAGASATAGRMHTMYTNMSQARTMGVAASALKGPNKFKSALDKIGNTAPTNGWMFFPRIEVGAAQMEVLGGQRRSLWYNEGLQDIVNQVAGTNIDPQSRYLVSDRMTQIGADAVTSLALGTLADNFIAAVKYAGRVRGVPQRGLQINREGTDYIKVAAQDIPFAPDWRRAWFNLRNGLQDMPIGTIADSKANELLGRSLLANPGTARTLADVVTVFKHNSSDVLKNLRDEIETSIREYDIEFGRDIRLDESDILARRDRIYAETLDNLARGIEDMFNVRSVEGGVPMNLMFADMLSELAPTIRRIDYQRPDGTFKRLLSKTEAATVQAQNPGSVLRRVGNAWQVYEPDPDYWSTIVARQMRETYAAGDVDHFIERAARAEGIDRQAELTPEQQTRLQQLSDEAENVLGRPLVANGKIGRVIDFDSSGYTVITRDGEIVTGVQSRNLDLARQNNNYEQLPPFLSRENQLLLPARSISSYADDYAETIRSNNLRQRTLLNEMREDATREYVNALRDGYPGPIARARARMDGLAMTDLGDLSDIPILRQTRVEMEQKLRTALRDGDMVQAGLAENSLRALGLDDLQIQGVVDRTSRPAGLLAEYSEGTALSRNLGIALNNHERAIATGDPIAIRESEQALRNAGVTEEQLYQVNVRLRSSQVENASDRFRGAVERGDITEAQELRATLRGFGMTDEGITGLIPQPQRRLPAVGTVTNETRRQELITRNIDDAVDRVNAGQNPESSIRTLRGLDAPEEQVRQRIFDATEGPVNATRREIERVEATYKEGTRKNTRLAELQRELDVLESDQRRALRLVDDIYNEGAADERTAAAIAGKIMQASRTRSKLANAPEGRVVFGPEDSTLGKYGLSKPFIESVIGGAKVTPALVRKLAMVFGVNSNGFYYALGRNVGEITQWKPKTSASKGTIVKHEGSYYMARQKVPAGEHVPSQWVVADNSMLVPNKYWARVDINETIDSSGALTRYVRDEDDLGYFYRPMRDAGDEGKDIYHINVQKPVAEENISFEQIIANEIDAIAVDPALRHYRLLHGEQAVKVGDFENARTTRFSAQQFSTKFRGDC